MDTVHIGLITFDLEARVLQELTPLPSFPQITLTTQQRADFFW